MVPGRFPTPMTTDGTHLLSKLQHEGCILASDGICRETGPGGAIPTEKWWSESQLGWWTSQLNGKIIQMFQSTNQDPGLSQRSLTTNVHECFQFSHQMVPTNIKFCPYMILMYSYVGYWLFGDTGPGRDWNAPNKVCLKGVRCSAGTPAPGAWKSGVWSMIHLWSTCI